MKIQGISGLLLSGLLLATCARSSSLAGELLVGVSQVEVTERRSIETHDPLFVKAMVLDDGVAPIVLVTVDAVAIGELGRISDSYFKALQSYLEQDLRIPVGNLVVNASHCHGVVRSDVLDLTKQAIQQAHAAREPVRVGAGIAHEDRISENRRVRLANGAEADMRRAYAMPADAAVAAVGPIDPEIGLLRIDRMDGRPLAAIYHFACHPIEGVPSGGNTADFPGFASRVIEENLGEGVIAFFLQGCGGDINPARYKDASRPRDAEPLGNLLGLAALRGLRKIETTQNATLKIATATLKLPRATDYQQRIEAVETEQKRLVRELKPTNLNFKAFLSLLTQQKLSSEYPSAESQRYLHEKQLGREDLVRMDSANRAEVEAFQANILAMEQLTRLQANLDLLKMHQEQTRSAASDTLDAALVGLRVGNFTLVTFPGELTVEVGLKIKKQVNRPNTFVSGYTNGYIYYTPTAEQRRNPGFAQEDCDSLVAPEWEALFVEQAIRLIKSL